MDTIEQETQELAVSAIKELRHFFQTETRDREDLMAARIAASLLSTLARLRQVAGSQRQLDFMMARELAHDDGKLREYLELAAPSSPLLAKPKESKPSDAE